MQNVISADCIERLATLAHGRVFIQAAHGYMRQGLSSCLLCIRLLQCIASPSSQVDPVQPAVQVHVLGAMHTPPF